MKQPIFYIDTSSIKDGKLDELKASINRLVEFVEANVPQLISYAFYFDDTQSLMTVVAIHPDSDSLEFHMEVGKNEFQKFADLITLLSIEVYGKVSDSVVERLHRKAQMLGNATVAIHEFIAGFYRPV